MATAVVAQPVSAIAQHEEPAWRDKSDFVLAAELDGDGSDLEQLFVRQIDPFRFEICCIPFFLYDIAMGDVVETDDEYLVKRVVERSGRFVFRVWFGDTVQPRQDVADALTKLDALLEWSSVNLLAIDAKDLDVAQRIADYLERESAAGKLVYETGRS